MKSKSKNILKFFRNKKGFSMVELLIYIGLTSMMLLAIATFSRTLLQSRYRVEAIQEVEQQGAQIMHMITQTVRNSSSITSPAQGLSGSALSLGATQSVIFDLSSNILRISEGGGAPIALINSNVAVSNLVFHNLSKTGTPGIVRIQFDLAHANPGSRAEYSYSKTFYGSASIR